MKKNKIIIYPGTFNPITKAHIHLAQFACSLLDAKFLLFLPTGTNWSKKEKISGDTRFDMIHLSLKDIGGTQLRVSPYELLHTTSGTYESLEELKKYHAFSMYEYEYYILLGDDNLFDLPRWINADKLLKEYNFLVLNRNYNNQELEEKINRDVKLSLYKKNIIVLENKTYSMSSSYIRDCIKNQDSSWENLLSKSVVDYIKTNQLYRKEKEKIC